MNTIVVIDGLGRAWGGLEGGRARPLGAIPFDCPGPVEVDINILRRKPEPASYTVSRQPPGRDEVIDLFVTDAEELGDICYSH